MVLGKGSTAEGTAVVISFTREQTAFWESSDFYARIKAEGRAEAAEELSCVFSWIEREMPCTNPFTACNGTFFTCGADCDDLAGLIKCSHCGYTPNGALFI